MKVLIGRLRFNLRKEWRDSQDQLKLPPFRAFSSFLLGALVRGQEVVYPFGCCYTFSSSIRMIIW